MMSHRPKTIQIFLPSGDPRGIQVASITTGIIQVIDIPRALLSDFISMPESRQVGIYFLIGEDDDNSQPVVYIGQTGLLGKRLNEHHLDSKKEFWSRALAVISLTNNLTQTHTQYLEWRSIQQANNAARYKVMNGNNGSKPFTPAPMQADCEDIFDVLRILVSTLGDNFLESLSIKKIESSLDQDNLGDESDIYYCKSQSEVLARGQYTEEGMVVLQGSKAKTSSVPSFVNAAAFRNKERLIKAGVLTNIGEFYVFASDTLFKTPSSASDLILGRSTNGWIEWCNIDNKTLDEIKRKPAIY